MQEKTVHEIIDALGDETVSNRLGVTVHSIRAAKRDRAFPARWYAPLKELCDERGVELSMSVFNWLNPDKKTVPSSHAHDSETVQGPESAA